MWEGRGPYSKMYYTSSSSAPTITRTPDIHEINSAPLHWQETCSMAYCTRVCSWAQLPYDHLAFTRRHSCDRFSQAFPFFCHKPKSKKKWGRPGNKAISIELGIQLAVKLNVHYICLACFLSVNSLFFSSTHNSRK